MTDTTPLFTDVKSAEVVGQTASGAFTEGVKVTFTTKSGQYGSIFVPRAEYTTAHVRDLITAAATTIEEVAALKG